MNGFKAYRSHQQIISNKKKQINSNLLEVPKVLVGQEGVVACGEHTVQSGLLLPHVHHSVLVQVTAKKNWTVDTLHDIKIGERKSPFSLYWTSNARKTKENNGSFSVA